MLQEDSAYCDWCERMVLMRRTRGAWGWRRWRCTRCGQEVRKDAAVFVRQWLTFCAIALVGCVIVAALVR